MTRRPAADWSRIRAERLDGGNRCESSRSPCRIELVSAFDGALSVSDWAGLALARPRAECASVFLRRPRLDLAPGVERAETIRQIITGDFVARKEETKKENPNRYRPVDFGLVMVSDVIFRTPAFIDSVLPGSAAAKQELRSDDLVLFVNEELIQSIKTLNAELGKLEAGDVLRLIVRRGDKLISVELPVERKRKKE